jgi:hypothetical protein
MFLFISKSREVFSLTSFFWMLRLAFFREQVDTRFSLRGEAIRNKASKEGRREAPNNRCRNTLPDLVCFRLHDHVILRPTSRKRRQSAKPAIAHTLPSANAVLTSYD